MQSMAVNELEEALESGISILDCRPTNDFASSHVPNSINASINGSYEYMATCLFDKKSPLIVIAESGRESEAILRLDMDGFINLSFFDFEKWKSFDKPTSSIARYPAKDASDYIGRMKDVSNTEDWKVIHVKGVSSTPLLDIVENPDLISEGDVLYCAHGHKSMAASSFMAIRGVNVSDITGGLSAMLVDAPDLEI
ncbi:MAG: rhodanese-like domain-containing protein [Candidatus Thermoplasmatota archaeon]|nr:rhodanese-like domain-containing protein [Candidatus Thermoplasmatota archaeon]